MMSIMKKAALHYISPQLPIVCHNSPKKKSYICLDSSITYNIQEHNSIKIIFTLVNVKSATLVMQGSFSFSKSMISLKMIAELSLPVTLLQETYAH